MDQGLNDLLDSLFYTFYVFDVYNWPQRLFLCFCDEIYCPFFESSYLFILAYFLGSHKYLVVFGAFDLLLDEFLDYEGAKDVLTIAFLC